MDVGDHERVIASLCGRFSSLIDQVQVTEARQAEAQRSVAAAEAQLRAAAESRRSALAGAKAALRSEQDRADRARWRLQELRTALQAASAGLLRAREAAAGLQEQCDALSACCHAERRNALDVVDVVAQSAEARVACDQERERLRGEAARLEAEVRAAEEDLHAVRECERHRRADVRRAEGRLADAARARQGAERRAAGQLEDLTEALQQVALCRDRLEAARGELQRRREGVQDEEKQVDALRAQQEQGQRDVCAVEEGLAQLRGVKESLDAALSDHAEVAARLRKAQQVAESHQKSKAGMDRRQAELEQALLGERDRLLGLQQEIKRERETLRSILEGIREHESQKGTLEGKAEQLKDTTLQAELQRAFTDVEQMRSERDSLLAVCGELQRKLRSTEPALEVARHRCGELELAQQDLEAELHHARADKEELMREVNRGREKMRGLRRRHAQLLEQVQGHERRILRTSAVFGGTLARGRLSSPPGPFAAPAGPHPEHPPEGADADPGLWLLDTPPGGSPARASPSRHSDCAAPDCLDALRQWIEIQEVRALGAAGGAHPRPPPRPSSEPRLADLDAPTAERQLHSLGDTHAGRQLASLPVAPAPSALRDPGEASAHRGGEGSPRCASAGTAWGVAASDQAYSPPPRRAARPGSALGARAPAGTSSPGGAPPMCQLPLAGREAFAGQEHYFFGEPVTSTSLAASLL